MKKLTFLFLVLFSFTLSAQDKGQADPVYQVVPILPGGKGGVPLKMECEPSTTLEIISCDGEDRTQGEGDNNPSNGAYMTWVAQGSATGLYYSQILMGDFSTQIVVAGTSISVFDEDPDGTMDINLAIGGNTTNSCLDPGTWTVRVWEVLDDNGDGVPDEDANGDIIGCFVECEFTFLPSCPTGQPFDIEATDIGCNEGGSISLINFNPNDVYCDGMSDFSWTGPNGFSSTQQDISNLAEGEYTFSLTDFYGCETDPVVVTIGFAATVAIDCGDVQQPPTVFGGSDGSFGVNITDGVGPYTIEWAGPAGGSQSGNNGNNTINNVPAGEYTVTVTDDETGCTAECTVTVEDPPCEVAFTVETDAIGNVVITVTGGEAPFFVSYTGTSTASQDDLGPYNPTPGNPISLAVSLFEAGEYFFTVYEGGRPDCSTFEQLIIEGADCTNFAVATNVTQPTCGQNNGSISATLSGGNGDMTITWTSGPGITNDNENDLTLTNLPGGDYSYQALDEEGCFVEETIELNVQAPLVFNCGAVDETCPDAEDGKIGLIISGGTPPYILNYNFIDPDGTAADPVTGLSVVDGDSLFTLPPGDYFLQIFDANNCSVECNTVIEDFNCPFVPGADQTVAVDSVINAPHVDSTGGVILSFTGTPDWTYRIVSTTGGLDTTHVTSVSPDTMLRLPIDTYQMALILPVDPNDDGMADCCSAGGFPPITFIVRGPECMLTAEVFTQDPFCAFENSGSITVVPSGAIGDVSVVWSGEAAGATELQLLDLPAGFYQAILTDEAGCEFVLSALLTDPEPVSVVLDILTEINCAGESSGEILATQDGALAPVNYLWSEPGAPDQPVLSGVPAGGYSVTIVDANGCTAVSDITLDEPDPFTLSCGSSDETNIGSADGKVFFIVEGGAGALTFLLNGVPVARPALDTFNNLAPGTYVLDITDENGCLASCTTVVNAGGCGEFNLTAIVTQPDCDSATGSIVVATEGNNGTVTFDWTHGPNTALLTDLTPGEYTVTATDEFNCVAVATYVIEAFTDFPALTVGNFPTVCASDCAEVSYVLSGPAPVRLFYTISQSGTQVQGTVAGSEGGAILSLCPGDLPFDTWDGTTVTFDSLLAGNGCVRLSGEVRPITTFDVATGSVNPLICATDTFRMAGEAFFRDRPTGVVVLDQPSTSGCDSTVSVSLSFFDAAVGNVDPVICASDSFFLGDQSFQADRTTGEVVLAGASANGCDSTITVNLSFFDAAVSTVAPVICASDTFFLGGQSFQADRTTGDVVLAGASANGCDSTVTVNLSFFDAALGSVAPVICASDTFFLGGQSFQADRTTGEVVLAGASANGCDSTVTVNLSFFDAALGSVNPVLCLGDTFFLAGRAFFAGSPTGDVVLAGQSANGCDSTIAVNVTFFAPAAAPLNPTVCATDTFFLAGEAFHADRLTGDVVLENAAASGCDSTVSVSLSFFPQVSGVLDTTICAGTGFTYGGRFFDVAVENELVTLAGIPTANGCDSLVAVTVRLRDVPNLIISGDGITCDDGILDISLTYDGPAEASVVLSSNPGETITLVAGTTTIQRPLPVGTTVTILSATDGGPCDLVTSGSITVTASDLSVGIDVISGDGIYAVSCADGSDGQIAAVTSGGTAPFSFDWNTGDETQMVDGLSAGTYSLIVTSGRGCQASASINLNEPDVLAVQIGRIPATCLLPDPALIVRNIGGGVGPYVVGTGNEVFTPVDNLPDTLTARVGTTVFTLEDANGCLLTQEFDFAPAPTGEVQVSPVRSLILRGDSVELTVLTDLDATGYLVTPGDTGLVTRPDFFVAPDSTTTYLITAVDSAGCTASAEALVVVDQFVPVYAPTAFSPNLDGNNDRFRIYGRRSVEAFSDFAIFDRWGNRVYDLAGPVSPQDENWGWDGTASDGRLRQAGVYVFSITVTFADGRTQVVKGDFVLAR